MRVLLIDPARGFYAEKSPGKIIKQTPNIGLAYLAAILKKEGIDVDVLDISITKRSLIDVLKSFEPDIVGISSMTFNIKDAYICAKTAKKFNPNILTVIGGPHPSALPYKTLKDCKYLDSVVKGEGEKSFKEIIYNLAKGEEISKVYINNPIEDLDTIPFPDWSIFNIEKNYSKAYNFRWGDMRNIYPIITARGCPFNCIFCYSHYLGPGVRFRSPENVIEEIMRNIDDYGASYFYFADDNFSLNQERLLKICDLLIENGINEEITWKCQSKISTVNGKTLKRMREASCELVFYGIETGNEAIQKKIGKNLTREMIRKAVDDARIAGLYVRASFIIGLPYETKESCMETINFAKSLNLTSSVFHILDVYPGTELERLLVSGEGGMKKISEEVSRVSAMVEVNDLDGESIVTLAKMGNDIVYGDTMLDNVHQYITELKYYRETYPDLHSQYLINVKPCIHRWSA